MRGAKAGKDRVNLLGGVKLASPKGAVLLTGVIDHLASQLITLAELSGRAHDVAQLLRVYYPRDANNAVHRSVNGALRQALLRRPEDDPFRAAVVDAIEQLEAARDGAT